MTYAWVMSHTHASCYVCRKNRIARYSDDVWMSHVTHTHNTHTCHVTYTRWLIHTWRDSFIYNKFYSYVPWFSHMWHASFICAVTPAYVTWLIYMWRDVFMSQMYKSCHNFKCVSVMSQFQWCAVICLCHGTLSFKTSNSLILQSDDIFIYMGWLRLVGSIKSQVSLAEYSLFYRALLQKRPII